jgi:hypothetical protein
MNYAAVTKRLTEVMKGKDMENDSSQVSLIGRDTARDGLPRLCIFHWWLKRRDKKRKKEKGKAA